MVMIRPIVIIATTSQASTLSVSTDETIAPRTDVPNVVFDKFKKYSPNFSFLFTLFCSIRTCKYNEFYQYNKPRSECYRTHLLEIIEISHNLRIQFLQSATDVPFRLFYRAVPHQSAYLVQVCISEIQVCCKGASSRVG